MTILFSTLKKVLFWSYERGSWQYDLMCVLILAFVFLAPNRLFHGHRSTQADGSAARSIENASRPIYVARQDIVNTDPAMLNEQIADYLEQKYYLRVTSPRIESVADESGRVKGYLVWEK